MSKVKFKKSFYGHAIEIPYEKLRRNIYPEGNFTIFLIKNEKIVHLAIPHGEIFHCCTDDEWDEILKYIDERIGLPQKRWESFVSKIISLFRAVVNR